MTVEAEEVRSSEAQGEGRVAEKSAKQWLSKWDGGSLKKHTQISYTHFYLENTKVQLTLAV